VWCRRVSRNVMKCPRKRGFHRSRHITVTRLERSSLYPIPNLLNNSRPIPGGIFPEYIYSFNLSDHICTIDKNDKRASDERFFRHGTDWVTCKFLVNHFPNKNAILEQIKFNSFLNYISHKPKYMTISKSQFGHLRNVVLML